MSSIYFAKLQKVFHGGKGVSLGGCYFGGITRIFAGAIACMSANVL